MNSDINKFLKLQNALVNEKAKLEARLNAISKVLGGDSVAASSPDPTAPTTTTKGKRTFSATTKAKMAASQKLRWAAKKGKAAGKAIADAAPAPKKAGRKLSEATKSKMRAAHQARWAKLKGKAGSSSASAPATAPAAKKAKRVISPEAKARMIAGAKKRWAKVNAAKAKVEK